MSADPDVTAGLRAGIAPLDGVLARAGVDAGAVNGAMTEPLPGDQPMHHETGTVPAPREIPPANGPIVPASGQNGPLTGQSAPANGPNVPANGQNGPLTGQSAPVNAQNGPANGQSVPANGQIAPANGQSVPANGQIAPANGHGSMGSEAPAGCTAAQLRRFIKSRAYVPMHELRRRFELNGEADDVSPVDTQHGLVYLGLPTRESRLIGELVRQGEVGVELCRDPRVPIVVGVYPMRPITRQ